MSEVDDEIDNHEAQTLCQRAESFFPINLSIVKLRQRILQKVPDVKDAASMEDFYNSKN